MSSRSDTMKVTSIRRGGLGNDAKSGVRPARERSKTLGSRSFACGFTCRKQPSIVPFLLCPPDYGGQAGTGHFF
jgi:hypothetical protein